MENNTTLQVIPNVVLGALADAFQRDIQSIRAWVKKRDDRLTSDKAKDIYKKFGFSYNPVENGSEESSGNN